MDQRIVSTSQTQGAVNVRFDDHDPVGPILSRRDQRMIVLMVCGLGVVLFGIKLSSNPNFWTNVLPDRFPDQQAASTPPEEFVIGGVESTRPLSPDEFISTGGFDSQPDVQPSGFDRRNAIDDSFTEKESQVVATNHNRAENPFTPQTLNSIRDNTMGVRANETDAYYLMLAAAIRQPAEDQSIQKNASFPVLMTNSDYYRGSAVQITGKLKRLVPFEAGENRFRIGNLYDAWIFTRESGNRPYHVVCSSVKNLPLREDFTTPPEVTVTGYFFKREGYSTQTGTLNSAPLVLAGNIRPRPIVAQVVASDDGQIQHYLSWFALIIAGALLFTFWNFAVSDWNYRFSRANQSLAPPATADLVGIEAVDINDVLRNLAETHEREERMLGR